MDTEWGSGKGEMRRGAALMCGCTGQYPGDLPTADKIAATSSNYLPMTPSSHFCANLIAAITTRFNKQVSDGKEHKNPSLVYFLP